MNQIAILPQGSEREQGSKVQLGNIQATKHVADIIRTCLGPRSMYKMLMDPQVCLFYMYIFLSFHEKYFFLIVMKFLGWYRCY